MRPQLSAISHEDAVLVKNIGKTDAVIHHINVFLYHDGRVFFMENMPDIRQVVTPKKHLFRLPIPVIPGPFIRKHGNEPAYMKMSLQYFIPGFPVFRYKTVLYLKYEHEVASWKMVETIPAKYRALGKAVKGDIEPMKLETPFVENTNNGQ